MDKKVRFEEVARGKLIDMTPQSRLNEGPAKMVRPRKKPPSSNYYANKIVFEHSDELMPLRMRPRRRTLLQALKVALNIPQSNTQRAPVPAVPAIPAVIFEQRIVFPEPGQKPKGPVTVKYTWSETDGIWNKRRSSVGTIFDTVASIGRATK